MPYWIPTCDRCKIKLKAPGAIMFGPPNISNESKKIHFCTKCYDVIMKKALRRVIVENSPDSLQEFMKGD